MAHIRKEHASIVEGFEQGWDDAPRYSFHAEYQNAVEMLD
eukprot:gene3152-3667_t